MLLSNISTRPRPAALARYMAASASRSRAEAVSAGVVETATPMLADTV